MAARSAADGRRGASWGVVVLLALAGACGHDWSAAEPDDGATPDAEADGGGDVPAEADAETGPDDAGGEADGGSDADDAADDADVGDDAGPSCGNGVVEPGEECDRDPDRVCTSGPCAGTQGCTEDCVWGSCSFGTPPEEDDCDAAGRPGTIPGTDGASTYEGTTCGATDDAAPGACGAAGGADVVYRLELTDRRTVSLDTLGSSFDAVVRIREATGCPGTELACDDDSAGGTPDQGFAAMTLDPGSYWIVIDGDGPDEWGEYVLNVLISNPTGGPANDTCGRAVWLGLSEETRLRPGTTIGANNFPDGCGMAPGADVWYRFDLEQPTLVYLDTLDDETWDSVLQVRQGTCAASTTVSCEDDACGGARSRFFDLLEPGSYYVLVDGRSVVSRGDFVLRYQGITGTCARDAMPILADGRFAGSNVDGVDHTQPGCVFSRSVPDVIYYLPLCGGETVAATTCDAATDFNTVLSLWADGCDGRQLACHNDLDAACTDGIGAAASAISETVAEPGLYILSVDGGAWPGPSLGDFGLTVSGL